MKVLVVDDEPEVGDVVSLTFAYHRPDYQVIRAENGLEALRLVETDKPDILILDVAMPGLSGFDVTDRLRARSDIPIILLTARGLEEDKVKGLQTGADDYVVKPFGPKELVARVDAVMRRVNGRLPEAAAEVMKYEDLRVDFNTRTAHFNGLTYT